MPFVLHYDHHKGVASTVTLGKGKENLYLPKILPIMLKKNLTKEKIYFLNICQELQMTEWMIPFSNVLYIAEILTVISVKS